MKILKNILIQEANVLTRNLHRYKQKTLKKIAKKINNDYCYGHFEIYPKLDVVGLGTLQIDQIAFYCTNARFIDNGLYCDIIILNTHIGNIMNNTNKCDIYFGLVGTGKMKENCEIYDYEFCRIDAYKRK